MGRPSDKSHQSPNWPPAFAGEQDYWTFVITSDAFVPPTLNLDNPSESCIGVDLVPHVAKKREVRAVLNNSFGFGGTNASLVMTKVR